MRIFGYDFSFFAHQSAELFNVFAIDGVANEQHSAVVHPIHAFDIAVS